MSTTQPTGVSRRTLAKGAAWAAPAVLVATAAPQVAASLQKDPGINGWVRNTPERIGPCRWTLDVNSNLNGYGPDGAPFGLYIYDVEDPNTFSNAKLTYWVIGNQQATWVTRSGHSSCWSGPTRGTPTTKKDGYVYTPYTWTYTCPINAADRRLDADGVERLYLGHFHVQATFTQPSDYCNNVTYWTQRFITIDPDGPTGPLPPKVHTFERRNGTLGPYTGRTRMAPQAQKVETASPKPAAPETATPETTTPESAAPETTTPKPAAPETAAVEKEVTIKPNYT